jgi:hypothetical protein
MAVSREEGCNNNLEFKELVMSRCVYNNNNNNNKLFMYLRADPTA